ncbi:long-chain fatty acid transport protein [Vibrio ishigakensis]|uniref:Long-chain fatty acid transport protein n=1 Tax=Vibrio ishigakensis TaxID=1481914 RepID=A0A0B8NSL4_9VIBR|nr:long-chain fatty acid transport protein [Vibrio ishigakensis]
MKNKYQVIAASTLLLPCLTQAAGFQLNSQSATGLGRAFAGDAVIADSAAIVSKNAAAMAYIEQPSLSLGAVYIDSSVDVTDIQYTPVRGDTQSLPDESIGAGTLVPNLHYVHPLQDSKFTLGFTVHSNFGTNVEYDDSFEANSFGGKTYLSSINTGVAIAYELTDKINLGAGLDVIYGTGEIYRDKGAGNDKGLLNVDADGFGLGGNLGVTYQINENHKFGLSYRYSPDIEVEGTINKMGQAPASKMNVPLPDMAEFSGWHKLAPQIALHYSLQWVKWSEFDALTSPSHDETIKDYNWKDAGHISIGATYDLSKNWVLRTGYMFDASPIDQLTSLSIPDSDRHWISFGSSYHFNDNSTVDLGVSWVIGEATQVDESLEAVALKMLPPQSRQTH